MACLREYQSRIPCLCDKCKKGEEDHEIFMNKWRKSSIYLALRREIKASEEEENKELIFL